MLCMQLTVSMKKHEEQHIKSAFGQEIMSHENAKHNNDKTRCFNKEKQALETHSSIQMWQGGWNN